MKKAVNAKKRTGFPLATLCCAILLIGLVGLTTPLIAQQSQTDSSQGRVKTQRISFLIEQGFILPPQALARFRKPKDTVDSIPDRFIINETVQVPGLVRNESSIELTFSMFEGNARFQSDEGVMATTLSMDGRIMTPAIISSTAYDESFFRVIYRGHTIIDRVRVATLPVGGIGNLGNRIIFADPSVITLGDHFAVVDESRITDVSDEAITFQSGENTNTAPNAPQTTASLCIRTPFAPGLVKWNFSNPGRTGAGFSVKPESSYALIWASAPSNAIDAIYNRQWGCGIALKVPDSCTVTWNSPSSWSSCCNATFAALGYVPKWVNPAQHNFPYCPLF